MALERVQRQIETERSADAVWAEVRDFCAPWHPVIATMTAEAGGGMRAFTVKGEDTQYRERRTWHSDSDRAYGYTHLSGISGARRYDARLTLVGTGTGCVITMSAEIEASAARAAEIARGTAAIFEVGLEALAASTHSAAKLTANPDPVPLQQMVLEGLPTLALTVTPPKPGPLLLYLHGIGGARSNWDAQLGHTGHICRSAALDLRGYGGSTLGSAQSTLDAYFDDIIRVRDALGASRLILCGLSYGAWIATAFAQAHPAELDGLILAGGCTGMSEAGPDEREAFRISREVPLDAGQTPADFAPAVVQAIAGPNASDTVKEALVASMSAIPAASYCDALHCFTNPPGRFDFSKMTMPVLLMTGAHDRLAPPPEIRAVALRIHAASPHPDVRFEAIKDAGHVCNLENPAAFNAALAEFARRITA